MGVERRIGGIQPFAEIAQGATTIVYKGYEPHLDRFVLLKVLKPEYCGEEALAQAFEAEARLAARVQHPNVVALYGYGREERCVYLAAEYVDGLDLRALTAERRLPIELAVYVILEAARGLGAAHENGVLHRDVKPSNILVSYHGHVKLTDFGMASLVAALDGEGHEVRGTLAYLAPEQVLGSPPTAHSDLFALGATFFELLCGRAAFRAGSVDEYLGAVTSQDPITFLRADPTVPPTLVSICQRLLAKAPDDRYRSAGALVDDLVASRAALGMTAGQAALQRYLANPDEYRSRAPAPVNGHHLTPTEPSRVEAATPPPSSQTSAADRHGRKRSRRSRARYVLALAVLFAVLAGAAWWAAVRGGEGDGTSPVLATQEAPGGVAPSSEPALPSETPVADTDESVPTGSAADPVESGAGQPAPGPSGGEAPREPTAEGGGANPDRSADSEGDASTATAEPASEPTVEVPIAEQEPAVPREPGVLRVETQPWAIVLVAGNEIGTSGTNIELPPGSYDIELRNPEIPDLRPYQTTVEVEPGRVAELSHSFWKSVGRLRLKVSPWANVFIDGNPRGTVQGLSEDLVLAPGEHVLTLEHVDGEYTQRISVAAGEVAELDFSDLLDRLDQE